MRMRGWFAIALAIAGVGAAARAEEAPPAAADKNSASAVVERVQAAFLDAMKDGKKLGHAGRVERLAPVVMETHDFATFGQNALKKYWDGLSQAQRDAFIKAFAELGVATYAAIFDELTGDKFKIVSEKKLDSGLTLVHSIYTTEGSGPIPFDYELRKDGEKWRIVNLIAQGINVLSVKRSEFASVVEKDGFDALMKRLAEQTKEKQAGAKE